MYHTGPPPPPDVEFIITSYSVENFTTCLTWQSHKSDMYYLINTSRSDMRYNQTSTEICLRAEYNIPLQISVVTVNCAGKSEPGTFNISIGVALTDTFPLWLSLSPSAGCGPPSPPVNGSVGEWTSSRVGAQVTYSCDTHLVLVGETVATCSLPSLTWIPSSGDVVCMAMSDGMSYVERTAGS